MDSFAAHYLQKNVVFQPFIGADVMPALKMIVMIPCLNEPEIIRTLESLWNCQPLESLCEVIVIVNQSATASSEVKTFNQNTFRQLLLWKSRNDRKNLVLHPIYVPDINPKFAGAGMARKIGMDEAIRRFNAINKPDGVIVSTDSDCLFSPNYLQAIEATFSTKSCFAATLNFKHRIGEMKDVRHELGIRLYEDYLHYYKKALDFTGFPDSIYTIGSAFAVRAGAYVKQGGMNRRQAGEDFYFLNKLTSLGKINFINEAFVFPSARISDRVPFGTGAAMNKWMNNSGDLTQTYNFAAFRDLKYLFDRVEMFFRIDLNSMIKIMDALPEAILMYLHAINFQDNIIAINQNSSSMDSFRKRFFQFFNAFIILRYLNFTHPTCYPKQELYEAIKQLQESNPES
jgi:hypothetical protein